VTTQTFLDLILELELKVDTNQCKDEGFESKKKWWKFEGLQLEFLRLEPQWLSWSLERQLLDLEVLEMMGRGR